MGYETPNYMEEGTGRRDIVYGAWGGIIEEGGVRTVNGTWKQGQ